MINYEVNDLFCHSKENRHILYGYYYLRKQQKLSNNKHFAQSKKGLGLCKGRFPSNFHLNSFHCEFPSKFLCQHDKIFISGNHIQHNSIFIKFRQLNTADFVESSIETVN